MKIYKFLVVVISVFYCNTFAFAEDNAIDDDIIDNRVIMEIEINNIDNSNGNIMILLCRTQEEFLGNAPSSFAFFFPAKKKSVTAKITIPEGIYAIKVFHDENQNKILDLNTSNHPTEKFGFSNNFFGRYGELPPYNEILRKVDKNNSFVKIHLR